MIVTFCKLSFFLLGSYWKGNFGNYIFMVKYFLSFWKQDIFLLYSNFNQIKFINTINVLYILLEW